MTGCPLGYLFGLRETFGFLVCLCRTLGPGHLALQVCHLALCLAEKARVLNLLPFTVRVVGVQPHINAPLDSGVLMRFQATNSDTELAEIAVRSQDKPHA